MTETHTQRELEIAADLHLDDADNPPADTPF
jgi:hypothetical protein